MKVHLSKDKRGNTAEDKRASNTDDTLKAPSKLNLEPRNMVASNRHQTMASSSKRNNNNLQLSPTANLDSILDGKLDLEEERADEVGEFGVAVAGKTANGVEVSLGFVGDADQDFNVFLDAGDGRSRGGTADALAGRVNGGGVRGYVLVEDLEGAPDVDCGVKAKRGAEAAACAAGERA